MTKDLKLEFYTSYNRSAVASFSALVRNLVGSMFNRKWSFLTCYEGSSFEQRFATSWNTQLSIDDVEDYLSTLSNESPYHLSATTVIDTAQLNRLHEDDPFLRVEISTWDPNYLYGRENLLLTHFASVVLPLDFFLNEAPPQIVEARTELLLILANGIESILHADAMHGYVGDYASEWPINSFISYFESDDICAFETKSLLNYWSVRRKSLESFDLSELRSSEQRSQLSEQLTAYSNSPLVNMTLTPYVESVRKLQEFDTVDSTMNPGFIVLEYPRFLSRYNDAFFLRILEVALSMGL